jgi:RimJ/RimL family protein N-acetyltransferase|tara:strand:+ start:510 stop:1142 length:633 start_codon:yes stop_codon:yes gene_type:complete
MDFKKFTKPSTSPSSPGYIILKGFRSSFRGYELTSIRMEDAETIMKWRNEQMSALRQSAPLTPSEQKNYFDNVVKPSLSQKQPDLILLRFTFENSLIGYGGLVHIDWGNQRAEVSFLLETERGKDTFQYGRDCSVFLNLLMRCAFDTLDLNKIYTYSYSHRSFHVNAVEASGFRRDGVLREDTKVDGEWVDAVIASCLKSEYLKQYPPPQ